MKKIIAILLVFCLASTTVLAEEFDSSVDAAIRKEYVENSNLPPLPSAIPYSNSTSSSSASTSGSTVKESSVVKTQPTYKATGKLYTIKHGTKVDLVSKSSMSDWMAKGRVVTFSSANSITTKEGVTIPAGTIFRGRITDSHRPQISSNGGLIELCIDEIYFNGLVSKIDTKISLAGEKRVVRNDIKGQHTYWKNFYKSLSPGRKVYNATSTCAGVFLPIPFVNILAIIPWTCGAVVYTLNFVASPFIAIFSKGGSLSIPSGTHFQIKIKGNAQIRG